MPSSNEKIALWETVKSSVASYDGFSVVEKGYFFMIKPLLVNNSVVVVETDEDFVYDFLTSKRDVVVTFLSSIFGETPELLISKGSDTGTNTKLHVVKPDKGSMASSSDEAIERSNIRKANSMNHISSRFTFDNFVVGDSNSLAYSACLDIAKDPGKHNPFFLYSKTGLGKTHLLFSILTYIQANHPSLDAYYVDSTSYFKDFTDHQKKNMLDEFHDKYRNLDVLLVDDIQFFLGRGEGKIMEDFFNTYNFLYERGIQIVLASDSKPDELRDLGERITTRLQQGLYLEMSYPNSETKYSIVSSLAEENNMDLSDSVINYIASLPIMNIRDLEGAFNTIKFYSNFNNEPITEHSASIAIGSYLKQRARKIDFASILAYVAKVTGVTVNDLTSMTRVNNIVEARDIAIFLTRKLTDFSTPQIGSRFGGRDHSSVLYSFNKIENRCKQDVDFSNKLKQYENELMSY